MESSTTSPIQVSYDFFFTNDEQIAVDDITSFMSEPWCVEAGQAVELQFQATVKALAGAPDVQVITQLKKTVGMEDPVVVAQTQIGQDNVNLPENMSMIFRETAKEDTEYQLMIMRVGGGANIIEPGFLQWGYKIYEDYTVTD